MGLMGIIEDRRKTLIVLSILAILSQVLDPPLIYAPGYLMPIISIADPSILVDEETGVQDVFFPSIPASLLLTSALALYSGYRMTRRLKLGLLSAGLGGALISAVPFTLVMAVFYLMVIIPSMIPAALEEMGSLGILAIPLLMLISLAILAMDTAIGFIMGIAGGLLGRHLRSEDERPSQAA